MLIDPSATSEYNMMEGIRLIDLERATFPTRIALQEIPVNRKRKWCVVAAEKQMELRSGQSTMED